MSPTPQSSSLPAALAVAAVPAVLGAVGFTGAGIAASSLAAKMMSAAAVANGGGVAAGSLVATLQSVGKGPGRMRGGGNRAGGEGPTSTRVCPRLSLREGRPVPPLQFRGPQCPWFSFSPSLFSLSPG